MFQSFFKDKSEGYSYKMIIENPVGSLRKRPYMLGERMQNKIYSENSGLLCFWQTVQKIDRHMDNI